MKMGPVSLAMWVIVSVGCATPQMKVPVDVLSMDSELIVATERSRASGAFVNESFKLGTYAVKDVDRDWDSTRTIGIMGFTKSNTTSGYSYNFGTEAGDLAGRCLIEGKKQRVNMGGVSMSKSVSMLGCSCETEGIKIEAVLKADNQGKYAGTVKTAEGEYTIKAVYEAEGSFSTGNPTGYRVDGDAVVAAADVMYPGKVWLKKSLSEEDKNHLSCLFTGLMLYTGKKDR